MTSSILTTKPAELSAMIYDEVSKYEDTREFYRWALRHPSHTQYTDPALRTVHEVAARALNPPIAHLEVIT